MRENARTRLAALHDKQPPTKAAQIRDLWPEINVALENGHGLKAVTECLAADGILVSVRSLSVYVGRMRKHSNSNRKPTPTPTNETALAGNTLTRATAKSEAVRARANAKDMADLVTNIRERRKKRPGFDYRPELADPERLISPRSSR